MTSNAVKPGPKNDHLRIDMPWEKAVGKAIRKPPPKDGWPEENRKKKAK